MLVRHDAKLHMASALQVSTFPVHHTGLPKVTQSMPCRGSANVEDEGVVYDPHACVGGLVDTWTSVNEIHGHIETGMVLR